MSYSDQGPTIHTVLFFILLAAAGWTMWKLLEFGWINYPLSTLATGFCIFGMALAHFIRKIGEI